MDAEVEKSLFKRAMGYQHPDKKICRALFAKKLFSEAK